MIAYLDCFSGIAGDMLLGALLDCGVPIDQLRQELKSLPVEGWQIEAIPVLKSGIHALKVRITLDGQTDVDELAHVQAHHQSQHHDHHHDHAHHHEHEHHHHGRSMAEIRKLIEQSTLSERVKAKSLDVFWRIAEVEAKMHHSTPEEIHFHEIGGLDSLLDIVGVCWCLEYLGVEEITCSPLPHSTGFVECAHGRMPVPAPATQELLIGVPQVPTEIRGEMVTPTGAGLVAVLAQQFGPMPAMTPRRSGFGAGTKDWPDRPNMLRVVIGDAALSGSAPQSTLETPSGASHHQETLRSASRLAGLEWRELTVVECNIDDMNPEFFALVIERLFEAGALDVWVQPLQMKKNRPAWQLGALCDRDHLDAVIAATLRETTTLGVRVQEVLRAALPRENRSVATPFGTVRVKFAHWEEQQLRRAAPEWTDVERLARQQQVPAREIYQAAVAAAHGYHLHHHDGEEHDHSHHKHDHEHPHHH